MPTRNKARERKRQVAVAVEAVCSQAGTDKESGIVIDSDDSDCTGEQVVIGHYGSGSNELQAFMEETEFPSDIRVLDPDALHAPTKLKTKLPTNGQVLLLCNPRGGHWVAVCIDFPNRELGRMGVRQIPAVVGCFLAANMDTLVDYHNFNDISPLGLGSQTESECGAFAALYCRWFGKERVPGANGARGLNIARFRGAAVTQMEVWRKARVLARGVARKARVGSG